MLLTTIMLTHNSLRLHKMVLITIHLSGLKQYALPVPNICHTYASMFLHTSPFNVWSNGDLTMRVPFKSEWICLSEYIYHKIHVTKQVSTHLNTWTIWFHIYYFTLTLCWTLLNVNGDCILWSLCTCRPRADWIIQFNSIGLPYSRLNSIICKHVVHNNMRSI